MTTTSLRLTREQLETVRSVADTLTTISQRTAFYEQLAAQLEPQASYGVINNQLLSAAIDITKRSVVGGIS